MYICHFHTGNILILRAIGANMELQTPTNLFLASLAVADLLISLFLPIKAVSIRVFSKLAKLLILELLASVTSSIIRIEIWQQLFS